MSTSHQVYRILELTDSTNEVLAQRLGTSIAAAAEAAAACTLQMAVALPPGSVTLCLQHVYTPATEEENLQARLSIHFAVEANGEEAARAASTLSGPFSHLHHLTPVGDLPASRNGLALAADVVHRVAMVGRTISPKLNPKGMPAYLVSDPFEPKEGNSYLSVDRALGDADERITVEIAVQLACVEEERAAHGRYLAHLQSINRTWDGGLDRLQPLWKEPAQNDFRGGQQVIKGTQEREVLVDTIQRQEQRSHERLLGPNLLFHIRVWGETRAGVLLTATTLAESAFEAGSYQLFESKRGGPFFTDPASSGGSISVKPMPVIQSLVGSCDVPLYRTMARLPHLAPVDELVSVFRPPLAGYSSPLCIRKVTDPPQEDPRDLIIFGYEAQGRAKESEE